MMSLEVSAADVFFFVILSAAGTVAYFVHERAAQQRDRLRRADEIQREKDAIKRHDELALVLRAHYSGMTGLVQQRTGQERDFTRLNATTNALEVAALELDARVAHVEHKLGLPIKRIP
jgi:hypothetical protein